MKRELPIANIGLFKGLAPDLLGRIEQRIVWLRVKAGETVIAQSDATTDVFFIGEGAVRANWFSAAGKEISFYDFHAGDLFGEFSAIDGEVRASSIVALEESRLGRMEAASFRELVRENADVAWHLIELLVAKARLMSDRVTAFGALAARQRLHQELVRLARLKVGDAKSALIEMPTHQEIANRIASHREAVTRELNHLEELGILTARRGSVEIHDLGRLAQMIERFDVASQ